MKLRHLVTDVPDFPKRGVMFKDIMPLLADAHAFAHVVARMADAVPQDSVDLVAGIDARGFILAAPVAHRLGRGFVALRKPGKLPGMVLGVDYALEYGSDRLELRDETVWPGARVLIVDDVLATGGTLAAAVELILHAKAQPVGASVLIELCALGGRARLPAGFAVERVLTYR